MIRRDSIHHSGVSGLRALLNPDDGQDAGSEEWRHRQTVVGAPISPVIKVCTNAETYRRLGNARQIIEGAATVNDVGSEIYAMAKDVASGAQTRSEALGHQEFVLTYKSFEPIGPACLPAAKSPRNKRLNHRRRAERPPLTKPRSKTGSNGTSNTVKHRKRESLSVDRDSVQ